MKETIIKCQNCGAENLSTNTICLNCQSLLGNNKKEKNKKNNLNPEKISSILKLVIGIISLLTCVFSCFNSFKLITEGLTVIKEESSKVYLMCILECIVPLIFLITGILCIVKRNSSSRKNIILLLSLYAINSIIALVPLFMISDIFYMIMGVNKISSLSVVAIISLEITIFWLSSLLNTFFNKKVIKIVSSVIFIILAIILCILLIKWLAPSDFLLPDYE